MTFHNNGFLAVSGGINYNHAELLAITNSMDSEAQQNSNKDLEEHKIIVPTTMTGNQVGRNTTMMQPSNGNHFRNEAILDRMEENETTENENITSVGLISNRQEIQE